MYPLRDPLCGVLVIIFERVRERAFDFTFQAFSDFLLDVLAYDPTV